MLDKVFILTDKFEFVPDKNLEGVLNFNLRASGYVFNKTLEYSIYRENFVKEFGIGNDLNINRTYTQKIIKHLGERKKFIKKADSTCLQASTDRLIKAYNGYNDGRTGFPKFKSLKTIQLNLSHLETTNTKLKKVLRILLGGKEINCV